MEQTPLDPNELDELDEEFDSVPEVDAVFRAQRRLSFSYGAAFLAITLTVPVLTLTSRFWNERPVLGGFTMNYLTVAVLYHVIYVLIGAGYTLQANKLEQELLGHRRHRGASVRGKGGRSR